MSISRRNSHALNRVLRDALRPRAQTESPPRGAGANGAPAYAINSGIPESYGDAYVRAIPKDPQNTFVYWELPKDLAEGSSLAPKGTAHVGNGEAVRIGETLNKLQRAGEAAQSESAEASGGSGSGIGHYDQSRERPRDNHSQDDEHQSNGGNRDSGNECRRDDWYQTFHHHEVHQTRCDSVGVFAGNAGGGAQGYYQFNDPGSGQYGYGDGDGHWRVHCQDSGLSFAEANKLLRRFAPGNMFISPQGNGRHCERSEAIQGEAIRAYSPREQCVGIGGAAFSEMLSALIERCNRHIADCRGRGGAAAFAMSSGLLCAAGKPL